MVVVFFISAWGLVLICIICLFLYLKQFHNKNAYFPNLYSKKDRKKLKMILKHVEVSQDKKLVRKILLAFYLLNVFILLPIIVEIYLFSK